MVVKITLLEIFFSKLEAIKTIDDKKNVGVQIQNMHDICKIAEFNISKSPELLMLNFANGLQSLRMKLPKHLQDRWRRSGQKYENQHNGLHPPFSYFVLFLNDLAKELNNKNYETPSSHQDPKPRRVLTTEKIPPKASVRVSGSQLCKSSTFQLQHVPDDVPTGKEEEAGATSMVLQLHGGSHQD